MSDLSNNSSFIPKQGAPKRRVTNAAKPVFLFTIFSYILLFATLIVSGGVYFVSMSNEGKLEDKIKELNNEIDSFSLDEMNEVIYFDRKLQQIENKLNDNVALIKIFDALEASTIDTVSIKKLGIDREEISNLIVTSEINTDSFDSTIFQRSVYRDDQVTSNIFVYDVSGQGLAVDENGNEIVVETKQIKRNENDPEEILEDGVNFVADIVIPATELPFDPYYQLSFSLDDNNLEDDIYSNNTEIFSEVDGEADTFLEVNNNSI